MWGSRVGRAGRALSLLAHPDSLPETPVGFYELPGISLEHS